MRTKNKLCRLHRWFFALALSGGVLLVLLPMLLSADGFTVLGVAVVTPEGFSAAAPAAPLPPPLTLTGLAARFAVCADRLLWAAVGLLIHAAAGALAVRLAPVGKKVLFVCGLLPFVLQNASAPAPEGWLPALFLLYFAQVLALAFAPVRAGGGRWCCFVLTGALLLWFGLHYKTMLLPALLLAGLVPLRRFLPRKLLAPAELPDAAGLRRAKQRRFWLGALRGVLILCFALGTLAAFAAVLPTSRVMHNLLQRKPDVLAASAAGKVPKLLFLLLAGSFTAADGTVMLHTGPLPLLWGMLCASSIFGTADAFRPTRRQRILVLVVCAVCLAGGFAAHLAWAELFSTALGLCWLLPAALWALTPNALVLRRERPGRLVFAAALALVLTALPGILAFI